MTTAGSHDAYLATVTPDQRACLAHLRAVIHAEVPGAEDVISYAMPGFRLPGSKVFAGYAARKNCGYYPHSGAILERFAAELAGWTWSGGAAQFTPDKPLPDELVRRLVRARLAEIAAKGR
jgi:uncharacterized protein YdhG (YjbR/CyaY superfamily)